MGQKGLETRNAILNFSIDLASAQGLEGLTIGRLAKELKMSKSGLFAHFGSKEDLQIASVKRAREVFVQEIVTPAASEERGIPRLRALLEHWITYVEKGVFQGGCFFFAVSAEMDDRPGPVRDLIAHLTGSWVRAIEEEIVRSIELGQIRAGCDVELLAFQLHGFVQEANWFYRLHGKKKAFDLGRNSIKTALDQWTTEKMITGGNT